MHVLVSKQYDFLIQNVLAMKVEVSRMRLV